MKKILMFCVLVLFFAAFSIAMAEEEQTHPESMGSKKCVTCHSDGKVVGNTKVVGEFDRSIHSYSGLTCGSCHGDEQNFAAVPTAAACQSCHYEQVKNVRSNLTCQTCHIVHTFNVHGKK